MTWNGHPCHYTGKPAFADVTGGVISAGYGSRHDTARFVFLKERPLDLPDGTFLSDDILDAWVAEGRIAAYEDWNGRYPALAPDTLAAAFTANRSWASKRLEQLAAGVEGPAEALRMFLGVDRGEDPDPVRLVLIAVIAEAITGNTVTLQDLLAPWEDRRRLAEALAEVEEVWLDDVPKVDLPDRKQPPHQDREPLE